MARLPGRIVKHYGTGGGNRFAAVEVDGRRTDVRTRTGRSGSTETRTDVIKRMAYQQLGLTPEGLAPGQVAAVVAKRPAAAKRPAEGDYQIEIANRISKGRAVGTDYVVTQRPLGRSGILARFPTREEAADWVAARATTGKPNNGNGDAARRAEIAGLLRESKHDYGEARRLFGLYRRGRYRDLDKIALSVGSAAAVISSLKDTEAPSVAALRGQIATLRDEVAAAQQTTTADEAAVALSLANVARIRRALDDGGKALAAFRATGIRVAATKPMTPARRHWASAASAADIAGGMIEELHPDHAAQRGILGRRLASLQAELAAEETNGRNGERSVSPAPKGRTRARNGATKTVVRPRGPAATRRFGSEDYGLVSTHETKPAATAAALRSRSSGRPSRVIGSKGAWTVYALSMTETEAAARKACTELAAKRRQRRTAPGTHTTSRRR